MIEGENSALFTLGDDDDDDDDLDDAPFKSTTLAESGLIMGGNTGTSNLFGDATSGMNSNAQVGHNGASVTAENDSSPQIMPEKNINVAVQEQAQPITYRSEETQDPLNHLNSAMGDLIVDNSNYNPNSNPNPMPGMPTQPQPPAPAQIPPFQHQSAIPQQQSFQQPSSSPAPSHFYRDHNNQHNTNGNPNMSMNANQQSAVNPNVNSNTPYQTSHTNYYTNNMNNMTQTSYSYSTPAMPMANSQNPALNQPYPPQQAPSVGSSFTSRFTSTLKSTFTSTNLPSIPTPSFSASSFIPTSQSTPVPSPHPSQSTPYAEPRVPMTRNVLPKVEDNYKQVKVSNPHFFPSSNLFRNASGGYWMYQVTTTFKDDSEVQVHRRFSHFVALEERLHEACPGSILPPRPDKKNSMDESGLLPQSSEFAKTRANELQLYLRTLLKHPHAVTSPVLQFFLTLPDIGSIWPDVSHSTMTRLSAMGSKAVSQLGEKTTKVTEKYESLQLEDDPELSALMNSEDLRLAAIEKHIPSVSLLVKEIMPDFFGLKMALGMEASKCSKNIKALDNDLSTSLQILSSSALRDGRQSKRLSQQLASLFNPFWKEYKQIGNVRLAIEDRRNALMKKHRAQYRADYNAARLMREQTGLLTQGRMEELKRLEEDTKRSEDFVNICEEGAEEVGDILKSEVMRLSKERRRQYLDSMKNMVKHWRECCDERTKLWEGAKKLMEEE